MVASSDTSLEKVKELCISSDALLTDASQSIRNAAAASIARAEEQNLSIANTSLAAAAHHAQETSVAGSTSDAVVSALGTLTEGVSAERSALQATVSTLLRDIDAAVAASGVAVQNIGLAAAHADSSVEATSTDVRKLAQGVVDDIDRLIAQEGAATVVEMHTYFEKAASHTNVQSDLIAAVTTASTEYKASASQSASVAGGDTPRVNRAIPQYLPLPSTRDRTIITDEFFRQFEGEEDKSDDNDNK